MAELRTNYELLQDCARKISSLISIEEALKKGLQMVDEEPISFTNDFKTALKTKFATIKEIIKNNLDAIEVDSLPDL